MKTSASLKKKSDQNWEVLQDLWTHCQRKCIHFIVNVVPGTTSSYLIGCNTFVNQISFQKIIQKRTMESHILAKNVKPL